MKNCQVETTFKHNTTKRSNILPFSTKKDYRPDFKNDGFKKVIGEYSRLECKKELKKEVNTEEIIYNIIEKSDIDFHNDDINGKRYLKKIIKEYISNDQEELDLFHPYSFLYLPKSNNNKKRGEEEIAKFFKDVLISDENSELKNKIVEFFDNDKSKHPIINLILMNLPKDIFQDQTSEKVVVEYNKKLNYITQQFEKDFIFTLEQDDEFLTNNIENIFAYYYFYYCTQLIIRLDKKDTTFDEDIPLYYLLDTENSVDQREAEYGYNLVQKANKELLSNINLIEHINTLFGTEGLLYCEFKDEYDNLPKENKTEFIHYLKKWTNTYRNIRGLSEVKYDDFDDLINCLFESLTTKTSKKRLSGETKSRYALFFEDFAKEYFLKFHGSFGYILNITQEMLLLITSLCIQKEKILLKELYEEYEKRGLYFDDKSKKEIENILTRLNFIDKKSDSGDAIYVRRIL